MAILLVLLQDCPTCYCMAKQVRMRSLSFYFFIFIFFNQVTPHAMAGATDMAPSIYDTCVLRWIIAKSDSSDLYVIYYLRQSYNCRAPWSNQLKNYLREWIQWCIHGARSNLAPEWSPFSQRSASLSIISRSHDGYYSTCYGIPMFIYQLAIYSSYFQSLSLSNLFRWSSRRRWTHTQLLRWS